MQVFVCYPNEVQETAKEVRSFIRSVGLETWFDKDNLIGGDDWDRKRELGLADADLVVIICSTATTGRNGVYHREIAEALAHAKDRRLGTRYIIPLRLEDVPLPPELQRLQYIDHHAEFWRRELAIAFEAACRENNAAIPSSLKVAAAVPDEGGIRSLTLFDEREKGQVHTDWIEYEQEGEYWLYVNSVIRARALGHHYQARRFIDDRESPTGWSGGSDSEIAISEFYRKDDLVSLSVGWADYYAGAAHPNHGLETINFFGDQAGIITVEELFDLDTRALYFLRDYVNLDIKRQALEGEEWDVSQYVADYGWGIFKHFSFNEKGMVLNLSASSGLPHVLGYHDVYVPWEHIGQMLSPVARQILLSGSPKEGH
ncbi:toll/interleukin-1 receptor domain-containing protein [Qipengyuania atrilutea]|uniref:Toll/interleukin-1 receptor domain-containing protein n=1 Tax=Qipengyuania atrilutea TaxID=2744473 RepID=A0A850H0T6_9SPHN|nr:toll/interleukin-1 receptor domain-containing protein [Actirhodobacter atriluteus]NVD44316.1 toll/interleukin-1 receptor domain-containing protein [Actirhodobacter atriluteus]